MLAEEPELALVEGAGGPAAGAPPGEDLRDAPVEAPEVPGVEEDHRRDLRGEVADLGRRGGGEGDGVAVHEGEGAAEVREQGGELRPQLGDQFLDVALRLAEGALAEGLLAPAREETHPGAVAAQVHALALALDRQQAVLAVDDEEVDRPLRGAVGAEVGVVVEDVPLVVEAGLQRLEEVLLREPARPPERGEGGVMLAMGRMLPKLRRRRPTPA